MVWVFLTRAGGERDLCDELGRHPSSTRVRTVAPGIVECAARPRGRDGTMLGLAFARQAMRVAERAPAEAIAVAGLTADVLAAHRPRDGKPGWTWSLQVVAPDSADPKDPRRTVARAIETGLQDDLEHRLPEALRVRKVDADEAQRLAQIWVVTPEQVFIGLTVASQALSRWPGGRVRLRRAEDDPSRSGLKLEEAIEWVGVGPERGDLCVDLGAAPGGWSQVVLRRGAAVIAIDPGTMKIDGPPRKYTHIKDNAFSFVPPETVDWLLCDMAYRPREVAQMLAKWGRRGWARQLIANIKLPMKRKADMVADVLDILQKSGWQGLRARQLYHDREEVTLFGWLDPSRATRGPQAPFRARANRHPAAQQRNDDRHPEGRRRGPRGERGGRRGTSTPRGRRGGPRGRNRR